MRQQTMVANRDCLTKNGDERNCKNKAGPAEKKWNKSEEGEQVNSSDADRIEPENLPFDSCRSGKVSSQLFCLTQRRPPP